MKKLLLCLLIAVLTLSACSSSDPYQSVSGNANISLLVLSDPLTVSGGLINSRGSTLAVYTASIPQIDDDREAVRRINNSLAGEAEELQKDMASFFSHVKNTIGEDWDTLECTSTVMTTDISYELLQSPSQYICFSRTCTVSSDDDTLSYRSAHIFLSSTGWKVGFSALFGENSERALEMIKSGLSSWCESRKIPCDDIDTLSVSSFDGIVGIDNQSIFILVPAFFLSTLQPDIYTVHLSLSSFSHLLQEDISK